MKAPSGDLLFYSILLLAGGIYIAVGLPTTAAKYQVVSAMLAVCLVVEAILLLVRFRWSPEIFLALFLFLLVWGVVQGTTQGFTVARIGITVGAVFGLFAYRVVRREVRGRAVLGDEPSDATDPAREIGSPDL